MGQPAATDITLVHDTFGSWLHESSICSFLTGELNKIISPLSTKTEVQGQTVPEGSLEQLFRFFDQGWRQKGRGITLPSHAKGKALQALQELHPVPSVQTELSGPWELPPLSSPRLFSHCLYAISSGIPTPGCWSCRHSALHIVGPPQILNLLSEKLAGKFLT